jgi:tetratricopeptide (TPR) repeat protein
VLTLQGSYDEAFQIFEKGIPKLDQTTSLMEHFFGLSGKTVSLMRMGRLGEVLQIVRSAKEMAEKNGNDPWLFNFREAWVRMLALDFEGSARVCESILRANTPYPVGQPQAIGRIARGYAAIAAGFTELDRGQHERAIAAFSEVRDPNITPKFFVHWAWRMTAQLGISEAWLQSGNVEEAKLEADTFLHEALNTADPHLQALAWEIQARIALSQSEWTRSEDFLNKALELVGRFELPVAGWQIHATAWRLYHAKQRHAQAESHREQSKALIFKIAGSFSEGERLRETFLSAPLITQILNVSAEKCRAADG